MIITAPIRTTSHTNHPFRIGHLIIQLSQRGRHLVGHCSSHDHDIGLPGRGAEDDSLSVLVISGHGRGHHLDAAAGEAEGEGPEGALTGPIDDLPAFSSLLWLNEVGSEGLVIVCFCQLEDARSWNGSTFALGRLSTA
ncbi:unnamed protein product [Aspergillus udagawae]|uniref:Unnamed protein product n=1 Tax=Aspergillus udagawae TaxID=91492 RepID=A0A8H3PCK9_9EURO|nr:unnamed protein product [Aspergillus udagawae]